MTSQSIAIDYVRRLLWERAGGACGICAEPVELSLVEMDHVMPLSMGGADQIDNLQVAHRRCNRSKGGIRPVRRARSKLENRPASGIPVEEVAKRLGVTRTCVYAMLQSGRLQGIRADGTRRWYIPETELGEGGLRVEQAARRLQVSTETVRRWLRTGKLRGVRLGAARAGWRIAERDLARLLGEAER